MDPGRLDGEEEGSFDGFFDCPLVDDSGELEMGDSFVVEQGIHVGGEES